MKSKINLESNSFCYPTKEERAEIKYFIPKIKRLTIEFKSGTIEMLKGSTFKNAQKVEDIFWWNNCLNNRIGKLTETYTYLLIHFRRLQQKTSNENTDKFLLNYYIEIFYYFFFSTRDVLGQLLNVIYDLDLKEEKIYLNEHFIKKIESMKVKIALFDFYTGTMGSYDMRNSFNHRFTPTQEDYRIKKNAIKEGDKISFYSAREVKIETFITDIETIYRCFSTLMEKLCEAIK